MQEPAQATAHRPSSEWSLPLERDVEGAALARHRVAEVLEDSNLGPVADDATLVTSELVGNVLRHGDWPAELRVSWTDRRVRIEVSDAGPDLPYLRHAHRDEPGGLGLEIVAAVATQWGVTPRPRGKTVWAELALD